MSRITLLLVLALGACSGSRGESRTAATPAAERPALPPSGPAADGDIPDVPRSELDRVLGRGVGDFLSRHVEVEPVLGDDGFAGWRIVRLVADLSPWFDLRLDDVVIAVNRLPLEHPEDAQRAWETLRISSEVLIDLSRDGAPLSIRIPIIDDEEPPPAAPADEDGSEPPPE